MTPHLATVDGKLTIHVTAEWDAEGGGWTATSDDLPGLVTESPTLDGLLERVMAVIPDLLNAVPEVHTAHGVANRDLCVTLRADRRMVVAA